jgi:hypothetical protein
VHLDRTAPDVSVPIVLGRHLNDSLQAMACPRDRSSSLADHTRISPEAHTREHNEYIEYTEHSLKCWRSLSLYLSTPARRNYADVMISMFTRRQRCPLRRLCGFSHLRFATLV